MSQAQLKQRIDALEKAVLDLQKAANKKQPTDGKSWLSYDGGLRGDQIWAEMAELGRQYRRRLKPKSPPKKR